SAAFGTPPPRSADVQLQSAWDEPRRVGGTNPPAAPSLPPTSPPTTPPPLPAATTAPPAPIPSTGPGAEETPQHHGAWGLGMPDTGYPDLSSPETPKRESLPEPPQPGD